MVAGHLVLRNTSSRSACTSSVRSLAHLGMLPGDGMYQRQQTTDVYARCRPVGIC